MVVQLSSVVAIGRVRVLARVHIPHTLLQTQTMQHGGNRIVDASAIVFQASGERFQEAGCQDFKVFHGKGVDGEDGQDANQKDICHATNAVGFRFRRLFFFFRVTDSRNRGLDQKDGPTNNGEPFKCVHVHG